MKFVQMTGPALAAVLVAACGGNSRQATAPQRAAEQAEVNKHDAQDEAREARTEAKKERHEAQEATQVERGAERNAQWATERAALAEAQAARGNQAGPTPRAGATDPQPNAANGPFARADVLFAPNSTELSPDAKAKLAELAVAWRARAPAHNVIIEGYADSAGSERTNTRLSERRAREVADYLQSKGVDRERIATRTMPSEPAAKQATDQGHALNRRVEVIIRADATSPAR